MKAKILGTGKNGCMRNEIILDIFDAFPIRVLVEKAIKQDGQEENKSYERKKWQEFIHIFDAAYTAPSKMEEANFEHLY